jgi:hypothetical protein
VAWVIDRGLDRLRDQIDEIAPGRNKASDGGIGDAAHAARDSDHNPEHPPPPGNPDNQVDARDFTHDPKRGADMGEFSEAIRRSHDRRVSYVIFRRRIFSGPDGPQPWVWRTYTGVDPHTTHMHVSVRDATHDQTQDWSLMTTVDLSDATIAKVARQILTPEQIRDAVWGLDNAIPAARPPVQNGDYGDPDDLKKGNKRWTGGYGVQTLVEGTRIHRRETAGQMHQLLAGQQALQAAFSALATHGTSVDTEAVLAAVDQIRTELGAQLGKMQARADEAEAETSDLRARLAAALATT